MKGAKRFSNPARDGLAKETVALANAYGGPLVVGIDETDDHPKRARGPDPVLIPRIAACAEQMQQALDNLIDPPLAVFEVRGIEQPGGDGEGVLIIRTGSSTRAPHGHGRPPLAYMRRGSRSEPMTMRDLQSVLFDTRTRGERVSALLDERQRVLAEMVRRGPGSITVHQSQPFVGREAVWFRCTLVATEDLHLRADDLSRKAAFIRPRPAGPTAFGEGGFVDSWRPRLGGVENFDSTSRQFGRWFIGDNGIVDAYGFVALDTLHRQSLETLVAQFGIAGLDEDDLQYMTRGWHRLVPWPDSVAGLTALKRRYIIAPLSNGNVALLTNMAKHAGLPWDLVLSAEIFAHYKPDPETYLGAASILSLQPDEVMMVAAHNNDLEAAQSHGLATAFVPRVTEYGPLQSRDFKAEGDWTVAADDFIDLARKMGC